MRTLETIAIMLLIAGAALLVMVAGCDEAQWDETDRGPAPIRGRHISEAAKLACGYAPGDSWAA